MNWAKDHLIELDNRLFADIGKYICVNCIEDTYLKKWAKQSSTERTECDYCHKIGKTVSMENLISKIMDAIKLRYDDAANAGASWDGREGGYQCSTVDTHDLINFEIEDCISSNPKVIDDIIDTIYDCAWCKKDPYGMTEREIYEYSWKYFSDLVKYNNRYFFINDKKDEYGERYSPIDILNIIAAKSKDLGIVKILPAGTTFYRARSYKPEDKQLYDAKHLGAPPSKKAKNDRMSACGISVFYASDSIKTCKSEIYKEEFSEDKVVIGKFKTLYGLKYLDLTAIKNLELPSFFNTEQFDTREAILFFRGLNTELTRPIEELENIEYVPTQIFAEYFKQVVKLNGIKYDSAKDKGGTCFVLFFNNPQCLKKLKFVDYKCSN